MPKIDVNEIDQKLLDTIVPGLIDRSRQPQQNTKTNIVLNNPSNMSDLANQTASDYMKNGYRYHT